MFMPVVGNLLFGFHVDGVTDVPDAGGRLWRMTYEKNGAELVWLERDDDVKTFVIAFKTLPEDDTGVAHILEHSVLAGSRKYPVKSPFDEMRKSSVRVFMNAMTSRDATYYPFSTRNDVDFLNLADVYLDAVFHPLVLKDPMAFRQEGWHYEMDSVTGELSVNGVVFNEMKGVFASPDSLAWREAIGMLYPDTVYGRDSGGRPEAIPELTYERFKAFHSRFYHPSNARIFLDGNVAIEDVLAKLDSVLSKYDRAEVSADIPLQLPVDVRRRIPYGAAAGGDKAIFVAGWSVGTSGDPILAHALDVVAEYLCGTNESPLKKALVGGRLCRDASMDWSAFRQIPFLLMAKDVSEDRLDACRATIRETLETVCSEGFDRARVNALIDRDEFREREMDTGRPNGLAYFSRAFRQWLYGGASEAALSLTDIYAALRSGVSNGLFERVIRERMLENPHRAEIALVPDVGLERRQTEKMTARLAALRAAMTPEQIAGVMAEARRLEAYQRRKDAPEDIAQIPRLTSGDLPPAGIPVSGEISERDGTTVIRTRTTASGIAYATLYFPMNAFSREDLLLAPLFARLNGKLGTSLRQALDLQTVLAANIGRLAFSTVSAGRGRFLKVSMAALAEKAGRAFDLLGEILFKTRFDSKEDIDTILRQARLTAERGVSRDGRGLALSCARRGLSGRWAVSDLLHGERQLRWLQAGEGGNRLSERLVSLQGRLFQREGLVFSHTDNLSDEILDAFLDRLGRRAVPAVRIETIPGTVRGFEIDGDTGFAAWVAKLPDGMATTGAMRVATRILSLEYLHNEVREIGGAYGVLGRVTSSGLVECSSYRDPDPVRTLATMGGIGGALRSFVTSGADVDRYAVATVAAMEPYRSPADEANRAVELFVDGRDGTDEERIRREVLETSRSQLLEFADVLDSIADDANTCVVGGEKQLRTFNRNAIEWVSTNEAEP